MVGDDVGAGFGLVTAEIGVHVGVTDGAGDGVGWDVVPPQDHASFATVTGIEGRVDDGVA